MQAKSNKRAKCKEGSIRRKIAKQKQKKTQSETTNFPFREGKISILDLSRNRFFLKSLFPLASKLILLVIVSLEKAVASASQKRLPPRKSLSTHSKTQCPSKLSLFLQNQNKVRLVSPAPRPNRKFVEDKYRAKAQTQ
jgi:hypothetical protein